MAGLPAREENTGTGLRLRGCAVETGRNDADGHDPLRLRLAMGRCAAVPARRDAGGDRRRPRPCRSPRRPARPAAPRIPARPPAGPPLRAGAARRLCRPRPGQPGHAPPPGRARGFPGRPGPHAVRQPRPVSDRLPARGPAGRRGAGSLVRQWRAVHPGRARHPPRRGRQPRSRRTRGAGARLGRRRRDPPPAPPRLHPPGPVLCLRPWRHPAGARRRAEPAAAT